MRGLKKLMSAAKASMKASTPIPSATPIKVGVDLGTAFTVIMVTDEADQPLAGASVFADVVRDGVVWNFAGAREVVAGLKADLEQRIGRTLASATVTVPPAVHDSDHRAHRYVVEGAGMDCTQVIDEVTAANAVLKVSDGAVVDIGGGTTGIAVIKDGRVVKVVDEPSGGTHMSLVLAGGLGISFEEAEKLKRKPGQHARLAPMVTPVLEKMATIVARAIDGHDVGHIHLVGGTSSFTGIEDIMSRVTGVPASAAPAPMLVTPLGVASWAEPITD